jgi:hypothetical protein
MSDTTDSGSLVIDAELLADLYALLAQTDQLHLDLCDVHRTPLLDRLATRGKPTLCTCGVAAIIRRVTAWFAVHGDVIGPLPPDVMLRLSARDTGPLRRARDQLAALDGVAVLQPEYPDRRDRHGQLWYGALLRTGGGPLQP